MSCSRFYSPYLSIGQSFFVVSAVNEQDLKEKIENRSLPKEGDLWTPAKGKSRDRSWMTIDVIPTFVSHLDRSFLSVLHQHNVDSMDSRICKQMRDTEHHSECLFV